MKTAKTAKRGNTVKITKRKVMNAIPNSLGIYANIARTLKCSYVTIYNMCKTNPEIKQAIELERERMTDIVEDKFYEMIQEGNTQCILHYMKSMAKSRGYGEKIEADLNIKEIPPLNISFD